MEQNGENIKIAHSDSMTKLLFGFFLSLLLTLGAYFIVAESALKDWKLDIAVLSLALAQTWVQLRFFLHFGDETKPKWNLLSFLFMVGVVFIIVLGTLWIMYNLNERMMPEMP